MATKISFRNPVRVEDLYVSSVSGVREITGIRDNKFLEISGGEPHEPWDINYPSIGERKIQLSDWGRFLSIHRFEGPAQFRMVTGEAVITLYDGDCITGVKLEEAGIPMAENIEEISFYDKERR